MVLRRFRSISANLFYLLSGVVLVTVIAVSWQNGKTFETFIKRQIEDDLIGQATQAGVAFSAVLDGVASQTAVAVRYALSRPDGEREEILRKLLDANGELVTVSLIEVSPGKAAKRLVSLKSSDRSSVRLQRKSLNAVTAKIEASTDKWSALRRAPDKRSYLLRNMADAVQLPLIAIAVPFPVSGSKSVIWAVASHWQSKLSASLPRHESGRAIVVDAAGIVISGATERDFTGGKQVPRELLRTAFTAGTTAGYWESTKTEALVVGSFARLPKLGSAVLIERPGQMALAIIKRNIIKTLVWSWLFVLLAVLVSYAASRGLTSKLRELTNLTLRIARGDFAAVVAPRGADEVAVLGHSVNHMSSRIQNLLAEQVERVRLENELETAKVVQATLFPQRDASIGNLEVCGFYQPAEKCSGDWWGHFRCGGDTELICIGDATGHGTAAALVSTVTYSSCRTLAELAERGVIPPVSPQDLLHVLNIILCNTFHGLKNMTFVAVAFDLKNGTVTMANAGHVFPMVMPAHANDGRDRRKRKRVSRGDKSVDFYTLSQGGSPLGSSLDADYKNIEFPLRSGDRIILYTDGIVENHSPEGQAWGKSRLIGALADLEGETPAKIRDGVLARAAAHCGRAPLGDDLTLVIATVKALVDHQVESAS